MNPCFSGRSARAAPAPAGWTDGSTQLRSPPVRPAHPRSDRPRTRRVPPLLELRERLAERRALRPWRMIPGVPVVLGASLLRACCPVPSKPRVHVEANRLYGRMPWHAPTLVGGLDQLDRPSINPVVPSANHAACMAGVPGERWMTISASGPALPIAARFASRGTRGEHVSKTVRRLRGGTRWRCAAGVTWPGRRGGNQLVRQRSTGPRADGRV